MDKFYSFLLIIILLFSVHSNAQKTQLNKKERAIIWPLYTQGAFLSNNATTALQDGNTSLADSLIRKSIEFYPTLGVFNYIKLRMSLSDINGSNEVLKLVYARIENEPQKRFIMPMSSGDDYRKVTVAHEFAMQGAKLNRSFGDLKSTLAAYEHLWENQVDYNDSWVARNIGPGSGNTTADNFFRPRIEEEFHNRFEYWIMTEKFDEALDFIAKKPQKGFIDKEDYALWETEIYLLKKDFPKARKAAEGVDTELKLYYDMMIKLDEGDTEGTKDFFEKYYAEAKTNPRSSSRFIFQAAEYEFKMKNYSETLSLIEKSITRRGLYTAGGTERDQFQWQVYTLMADAYTGLGQHEKAKDNYNIALLSNPDYKPAISGLDKLNVKYSTEVATDKTPPVISLLEPNHKRGLEITSASANVFVKGIANDPSGIKEVLINGKKIYSQADGNFWSDVALNNGLNKITITAIDIAGNKSEEVFDIKKLEAMPSSSSTEIVEVTEKEGKNYCLLIAAQNYSDISIPSLNNPISDAIKLKIILKRDYGFANEDVISLFNPTTNDIKRQLLELSNTIQAEDNLVIFYAGHGIWVEKEKKGFWLMTDAQYNDTKTWLPNKDVLDLVAKLPSRHTLLITDACFSGSVFKTRGIPASAPAAIQELDNKISRVAITSGNDTEVPDESVFMKYLVKALTENKEKYLTAQKMFITQILEAVMTETKTEPRYGTLELAGHVGGDFIFARK